MKKITFLIGMLSSLILIASTPVFAAENLTVTVHDTENHGIYVTVGDTLVDCGDGESPFIDENGRTQVPVRAVSEALGKNAVLSDGEKTAAVSSTDNSDRCLFTIGSNEMTKNETSIAMDTRPFLIDGRCTFRFVTFANPSAFP